MDGWRDGLLVSCCCLEGTVLLFSLASRSGKPGLGCDVWLLEGVITQWDLAPFHAHQSPALGTQPSLAVSQLEAMLWVLRDQLLPPLPVCSHPGSCNQPGGPDHAARR